MFLAKLNPVQGKPVIKILGAMVLIQESLPWKSTIRRRWLGILVLACHIVKLANRHARSRPAQYRAFYRGVVSIGDIWIPPRVSMCLATRRCIASRGMNDQIAEKKPRASIEVQEGFELQEFHHRNRSHNSIPGDIWPQRVLIVTNPDRSSYIADP